VLPAQFLVNKDCGISNLLQHALGRLVQLTLRVTKLRNFTSVYT